MTPEQIAETKQAMRDRAREVLVLTAMEEELTVGPHSSFIDMAVDAMLAFADEQVAAETERCARVCEAEKVSKEAANENTEDEAYNVACGHCAAAIRSTKGN